MPPPKRKGRNQQLAGARSVLKVKREEKKTSDCGEGGANSDGVSDDVVVCASKRKIDCLKNIPMPGDEQEHSDVQQKQCWAICHIHQLTQLVSGLLCPRCFEDGGMVVEICAKDNQGFSSKLKISCTKCENFEDNTFSSPRLNNSEKENVAFQVNPKMVLFSHEIGKSHTALETFSTVMGIPNMHLSTFQGHDRRLSGNYVFIVLWLDHAA